MLDSFCYKCDMNLKILNNLKIKLIVLFLAFLVWFFVKIEDNYRYSFKIPLRVTNLGSNRIIVNKIPKRIKITSWGKGRYLFLLMLRKDIFYNLDVSKVEKFSKIALEKGQIKWIHEIDIDVLNIVSPETVEVAINNLITKKVAIIPDLDIITSPGYTVVDSVILTPDSVEIKGTESEIKDISSILTEHKRYKNIKRDLEKKIRLVNPKGKNIALLSSEVHFFVDIQKLMEKEIKEVPIAVINTPKNLKVTVIPSTLSLVLEGGVDRLLNVSKQDINAYIDYKKVHASKQINHTAYIETPDGTRCTYVKPKRFTIVSEKIR